MGFYGNATYYLPNGTAKYIEKNAVTTEAINEKAVTTEKIADNSITELKIHSKAVTADKIAIEAIQGLNGNRLDKDANDNLQRPSHIAKQTICGEYHPDKNASFEGDIALNTITGGENGNLALDTIDSSNIAPGGINDDCLEEDYVFFDTYTTINNSTNFLNHLISLKANYKTIYASIYLTEDIVDTQGSILSKGIWSLMRMQGVPFGSITPWLLINTHNFEQYIIELSNSDWIIQDDYTLLNHDYNECIISNMTQWENFLQSKYYKNKNLICNFKFDIPVEDKPLFPIYINETTPMLIEAQQATMDGQYLGFWFDKETFYLADKKGNIMNYKDDKFIIINTLQADLFPDKSIPLAKLGKSCVHIEDLGVLQNTQQLQEKLKQAVFNSSIVYSFSIIAENDSLPPDITYYAIPVMQEQSPSGNTYWQLSTNLFGYLPTAVEFSTYTGVEGAIKISTENIGEKAITPDKLDRSYRQISYFQKNRYDSLEELLLEVTEGFIENNLEPLDFYSKDQIGTPWGKSKVEIRYLGQQSVPSNPLYNHIWQLNVFTGTIPKINSIYMVNPVMENGIVSLKGGITQITEAVQGRYGVCSSVEDIVSKLMMQQGLADISYRNMFESSVIIIKTLQENMDWNLGNTQDIEITAPRPGTYTVYYIPAQKRFYLQGLDIKKQYYIYYETEEYYYTVEVV